NEFKTNGCEFAVDTVEFNINFCTTELGKDHSISEHIICIRLVPMNNSSATENTAEDFVDSATAERLPFDVAYVQGIMSLFIVAVKEL
ncbi:14671_t:CDS:2, partial [Funneliformis geosporum]